MAQKKKTHQFKLSNAEALLNKIEKETIKHTKGNIGEHWRDNLFEILMTRMEIAAKNKKDYSAITAELKKEPKEAPRFAKQLLHTMHNILILAKAPSSPIHVIAITGLYVAIVDVFLRDDTKDLAKTMAAIDKRLEQFEKISEFLSNAKQAA